MDPHAVRKPALAEQMPLQVLLGFSGRFMVGKIDTQSIKGFLVLWNIHQMSHDVKPLRSNTDRRLFNDQLIVAIKSLSDLQAISSIAHHIPFQLENARLDETRLKLEA